MIRKKPSKKLRKQVTARAKGCCEYCQSQQQYANYTFPIEHIIPIIKEGSNELDNLALSCRGCNSHKHAKQSAIDPTTGKQVPLYHPRKEKWATHFEWNENYTIIIGITPVGRATIKALKLNREFLINQRIIYKAYGVHPPKH